MKKTSAILLSTVFSAFLLIFPISADRTLPLVVDDAALLSEYERETLNSTLEATAEEISAEIAIVTVTDTYGKSAMDYADDFYDENGYGYGDGDDGVLLLVDMGEREWWITTHGYCEAVLSDNVLYTIENAFIGDLSSANYYNAFVTFAALCSDYIEAAQNGIILETNAPYGYDYGYDYDYGTVEERSSPADFILPSVIAGFIVSFIMVSVMKSGMKTVSSQISASSYLVDNSLRLTSSSDNYLYSNVTRTPRQTSSHSGTHRGGGGSHRSSSGRSHGGRGGRF